MKRYALLSKHNKKIIFNKNVWQQIEINQLKQNDYLFVFGGDGFILETLQKFFDKKIKIIFVNTGRVGFLSSIEDDKNLYQNINDKLFDNFYFLKLKNNDIEINAFNEMTFEISKTEKINIYLNKKMLTSCYFSKAFLINYIGSTGLARSCRYPIILRNNPSYIFDILDAPQYYYNRNINQPFLFTLKEKLIIEFCNKNNVDIKFDNKKITINNLNKFEIILQKSKALIYNINNIDQFIEKLNKLL